MAGLLDKINKHAGTGSTVKEKVKGKRLYKDESVEIIQGGDSGLFHPLLAGIMFFPAISGTIMVLFSMYIISSSESDEIIRESYWQALAVVAICTAMVYLAFIFFASLTVRFFLFRATSKVPLRLQFRMNPLLIKDLREIAFRVNGEHFIVSSTIGDSEEVFYPDTAFRGYKIVKPRSSIELNAKQPQELIIGETRLIFHLNRMIDQSMKKREGLIIILHGFPDQKTLN